MKNLPFGAGASKSAVKKIDGFRSDADSTETILIGQLGKDYNLRDKISGTTILCHALDDVYKAQNIVGGRIVFLECSDNDKVAGFYRANGFILLQKSGDYLQMIRYL